MHETRDLSGIRLILAEPGTKLGIVVAIVAFLLAGTGFARASAPTDAAAAPRVLAGTEHPVVTVTSPHDAIYVTAGRYQPR